MTAKFINIAISGDIGSGTSTLTKDLADKLGWEYVNAGDFFRDWHKQNNIPLEQTEKIPAELDRQIDFGFQERMKTDLKIIFESHLAGWLAKDVTHTYKILLTTNFSEAVKRVSSREKITIEKAKHQTLQRTVSLNDKFKQLYGVENTYNPMMFNLIVNTTNLDAEGVLRFVLKSLPEFDE